MRIGLRALSSCIWVTFNIKSYNFHNDSKGAVHCISSEDAGKNSFAHSHQTSGHVVIISRMSTPQKSFASNHKGEEKRPLSSFLQFPKQTSVLLSVDVETWTPCM